MRSWLIKKRWRRHTIAVVAALRLNRVLQSMRVRRRFANASCFMFLMANRPQLSLRRAREIHARNAALTLQKNGRMLVASVARQRQLASISTMQRHLRGYSVRSQNGGRLAEIRAKRKAEEQARRKAMAQREKTLAQTVRKEMQLAEQRRAENATKMGSDVPSALGKDLEGRLKKLEEQVAVEIPQLKEAVRRLRAELEATRSQLDVCGGTPPPLANGKSAMHTTLQPAVGNPGNPARWRRTSGAPNKGGWGFLDLLGITQNGTTAAAPGADGAKGCGGPNSVMQRPHGAAALQPPSDALRGLHSAVSAIEEHFAQASAPGSSKTLDSLGNDQKNKEIAVLVRGQLCTALSRVLLHGFKSFKLIGRLHIWDFAEASCVATHERMRRTGGQYSHAEKTMTEAVDEASLDPFFQYVTLPTFHTSTDSFFSITLQGPLPCLPSYHTPATPLPHPYHTPTTPLHPPNSPPPPSDQLILFRGTRQQPKHQIPLLCVLRPQQSASA